MGGKATFDDLIASGKAKFAGDRKAFDQLRGVLLQCTPHYPDGAWYLSASSCSARSRNCCSATTSPQGFLTEHLPAPALTVLYDPDAGVLARDGAEGMHVALRACRHAGTGRVPTTAGSSAIRASYSAGCQDGSGSYIVMACPSCAVRGPRSFSNTTPCWFTMNVMTPVEPYAAGYATRAKPSVIFPSRT